MQMNLIEANLAQRGTLPLPSAALVIDMRGTDEDDVMERLRVEVADLASEMKVHDLHHWRFLTDFLSFRAIPPLRTEDVETIRHQQKSPHVQPVPPKTQAVQKPEQTTLTGQVDMGNSHAFFSVLEDEQSGLISEARPFDVFQQRIEEITQEIDRIRNNRIAAVADLNKAGVAGRSVRDATVRIIFLSDAGHRESLVSAATYAAHVKQHFKKLEREGHQAMVSVTIVCLDNSAEAGPPVDLIQGLRWENDNSALIAGAMQTYLAELLLYVLLIIPPLRVNSPGPADTSSTLLLRAKTGENQPKGEWVTLPTHSYLIGLAAVEHSARWGRRWLNYGLVTQAVEVLQDRATEDDLERRRIKNLVETWLSDWRAQVAEAIPDRIPGNIQALQAIPNALNTAKPPEDVFTAKRFSFSIGEMTISDLEEYLSDVARTYIIPVSERTALRQEVQTVDRSQEMTLAPTLQDAVDSTPLIQQRLREWEDRDPALKKGTPLVNAQLEAQRILMNPDFFTGATGAVPRARIQLKELGTAISDFQNAYQSTKLDLMDRRTKLEKRGKALVDDLRKHVERIPFLGGVLHLAKPMMWLTFVLAFCLIFLACLLGLAWLEHVIFVKAPDSNLLRIMQTALRVDESPTAFAMWGVLIALILAVLLIFRRALFDASRPVWSVETIFWIELVVAALSGLLLSFSIAQLVDDPGSLALLSWIAWLPYASGIISVIAAVMLIIEAAWFWRWITHLMGERDATINDLRSQHRKDVNDVTHYIADTIALQLLRRTALTDGKGGPGSYYDRVDQLYKRLIEVAREAAFQRELAANRLALSLSDMQPGATSSGGTWLNLKIREEKLDVESLTDGYQRLRARMGKEAEELKEFAQVLLRMMGEELPIEIEQQFRDRPFTGNREQRQAQVLMATLATLAMRFSISPPSMDSMTPIIERYESIDNHYIRQLPALSTLIQTLRKRVRKTTLQPLLGTDSTAMSSQSLSMNPDLARENIAMAADGFATWEQMLWEHKDHKLDEALVQDGVLPKLLDDGYDPRAVMRHLQARTSLFGRTKQNSLPGDIFLLLAPSVQSRMFRQNLNIPSRLIIDFPDVERLLLLYIQRFTAEALFVLDPEPDMQEPDMIKETNGTGADQTVVQQDIDVEEEDDQGMGPGVQASGSGSTTPSNGAVNPAKVIDADASPKP